MVPSEYEYEREDVGNRDAIVEETKLTKGKVQNVQKCSSCIMFLEGEASVKWVNTLRYKCSLFNLIITSICDKSLPKYLPYPLRARLTL